MYVCMYVCMYPEKTLEVRLRSTKIQSTYNRKKRKEREEKLGKLN